MVAKDIEDFLKYKQNMTAGVNFTNNMIDKSQFAFFVNKTAQSNGHNHEVGQSSFPATAMPTIMPSYPN